MARAAAAAWSLALLLAPAAGWSQAPQGGELRVNTYTTGDQTRPHVAADALGNFVVVWASPHDGDGSGIFGQRFDASGGRRGAEFRVNAGTTGDQRYPWVVSDPRGNFIVSWSESGTPVRAMVQRFSSSGERSGPAVQANTSGDGNSPSLALNAGGRLVVVWLQDSSRVVGQRFDAGGNRLGAPFQANSYLTSSHFAPTVGVDDAGGFVVSWYSSNQQNYPGQFMQRFDAQGARTGGEVRVTPLTTDPIGGGGVAVAPGGNFMVSSSRLVSHISTVILAQTYDAGGGPVASFRFSEGLGGVFDHGPPSQVALRTGGFAGAWYTVKSFTPAVDTALGRRFGSFTTGPNVTVEETSRAGIHSPAVAADGSGNLMVAFSAPEAGQEVFARRLGSAVGAALEVDAARNGVLEPGETVTVDPSWRNTGSATLDLAGQLYAFRGPAGASYTITDADAAYGAVAGGATGRCTDCYALGVSSPSTRPAPHWDATASEGMVPATQRQEKAWTLHVGGSFSDVPAANPFYRSIETLLHHGVAAGVNGEYRGAAVATRAEMAVFVLAAREGAGWAPPPCAPPTLFSDVPADNPFCRWIEDLARRGVVAGCEGGRFCPRKGVSRAEMAVFLLRTLDGALEPPACAPPNLFDDVPETSPFCRWIEELARRGITGGCGGSSYCPDLTISREQLAGFVASTFGLTLYGP